MALSARAVHTHHSHSPGPGPSQGSASASAPVHRRAALAPARQTVEFSIKGPVPVTLDEAPTGTPGCSVVDLLFHSPSQVSELVFHNYYTAWLTVLVRILVAENAGGQGTAGAGAAAGPGVGQDASVQGQGQPDPAGKPRKESGWLVAVAKRVLMPCPHLETGSHDFVSILATESAVVWTELVAMRLVLRQPSPSWHTFHVEEVHVFAEPPRRVRRPGPGQQQPPQPPDLRPDPYDSVLQLLRHQTQAALRTLSSPPPSTVPPGPSAPARARQLPAYEINSLPPV